MTDSRSACDALPVKKFQFVGGDLALDFTNTVGGKRGGIARENLHTYRDFISWCRQAGLLDKGLAEELTREAARYPREAAAVLSRAVALREAVYNIFWALANRRKPSPEDLGQLNRELASGLGRLRVLPGKKGHFKWDWERTAASLDQPLGPVARAAGDLLTSADRLSRVHRCVGDTCGWLFIDASKNHSRRWCDMRDCGNLAKVRRHRARKAA